MIFIEHRKNLISELATVNPANGVEIDLRSLVNHAGKLHLSHDPWKQGDDFDLWLDEFVRLKIQGPIYLNTKEDGLEEIILGKLKDRGLENFLFLDTALPTLVKRTQFEKNRRFLVRLSAYEPLEFARCFRDVTDWLWADCFQGIALKAEVFRKAKELGFKICLVSPELHGFKLEEKTEFLTLKPWLDAICTKKPDWWAQNL